MICRSQLCAPCSMIKNRGRILRFFFSFLKKSICTIPRCEPVFFRIIHLLCCYRVYRKTGWSMTDFNFREINFTKFSWKFQEYLCWSLSYVLFCPIDNNMYILKKCNLNQWIGHLIPSEIIFFHFFWFCTWNLFSILLYSALLFWPPSLQNYFTKIF